MINYIVGAIIAVLVISAIAYIVKEKKKGVKCIGCSSAGTCAHANAGGCACGAGGTSCQVESQ